MNATICQAIAVRKVVEFYYDGGIRRVEPHCHGVSSAGNEVLRGYQVGGYSESGQPVGWKLYSMAKIGTVTATESVFLSNRSGYNPNDSGMSYIHCRV